MARQTNWETQIGRRLRLRDLHVLFTVAQRGSMAKAALELGISQPAVSDVIANLERALGVRLFDRSTQGVEPTVFGQALLKRSVAAFDELKQGVRDIEFLSDPARGELRLGCGPATSAVFLQPIIRRFLRVYPHVVLHVTELPPPRRELLELRDRKFDLIFGHWVMSFPHDPLGNDLNVEILFNDPLVVVAGAHNPWARRRKIDLVELINEPWILSAPTSRNYLSVAEAFLACGLAMPKISLVTSSAQVRTQLLADEPYLSTCPKSLADRHSLKVLPVDLPIAPWSIAIVTLKNRTLSPVVGRFIECIREVAKSIAGRSNGRGANQRGPMSLEGQSRRRPV